MSGSQENQLQLTRTVLIAAAAAATVSAVSSSLVFVAVAQLLRSTSHTHTQARKPRTRTNSAAATATRSANPSVDTHSPHRQSSLFHWCLRRLSGLPVHSDVSDESSQSSDDEAAALEGAVHGGPVSLPSPLVTGGGGDVAVVAGAEKDPLTADSGAATKTKNANRRGTTGSKGPRAYHTHDGGIITQYMDATTRLETDDYFKKNATQRRHTVALAERRQGRQGPTSRISEMIGGAAGMDLAVFDSTLHSAGQLPPPTPLQAGAMHPVASLLAQEGLTPTGEAGVLGVAGSSSGGRRGSNSLSLVSGSMAMPLPQSPIYRIVITGGPCSGKSTSMTHLKAAMERIGYTVYLVPEVATMMMLGGARLWLTPEEAKEEEEEEEAKEQRAAIIRTYQERIAKLEMAIAVTASGDWDNNNNNNQGDKGGDVDAGVPRASQTAPGSSNSNSGGDTSSPSPPRLSQKKITIQRVVLQLMMMLEDCFYELAAMRGKPSVIFYDRGTMDGSAYCSDAEWAEILRVTGYTDEELRDTRYDAVVHLVTAALGAEEYYSLDNNVTRHETRDEAIAQDMATRNVWRGHFLFYVCDNSTDFERKLDRVAAFVRKVVGASPASTPAPEDCAEHQATSSLMPTFGASNAGVSGSQNASPAPNDLQELAYIMTGTRAANKHMLLSPSNSRERSLSPSMGISAAGTPQSLQLGPGDSMRLDHSVLMDVNATTLGTTLMPTSITGAGRPGRPAAAAAATVVPSLSFPPAPPSTTGAADGLLSPTDAFRPFADNDSNSLHSASPQECDPVLDPLGHPMAGTPPPECASDRAESDPSADAMPRPSRRRVTLPPSDIAAAAAAATLAERRAGRDHDANGNNAPAQEEEDGRVELSPSPSPSPDIPETARTASAESRTVTGAGEAERPSRRQGLGASLTLNAEDLHHSDSNHALCHSMIAGNNAAMTADGQRQGSAAATFAESAAEGLQRHFIIRAIDMSQIPENAVESEVTLITLVPTRREYVSETIIRVLRSANATSASTRPVYLRRVEFARRGPRGGDAKEHEDPHRHAIRNVTTRALSRDDFLRLAQFFDPAQPLVRKQVKRFLYGFNQLSVVSFLEPEELRGAARVICSAEVSADDLPDWIEVEEVSLTGRDVLV